MHQYEFLSAFINSLYPSGCFHALNGFLLHSFTFFFLLQMEPSSSCVGSVWTNLKHLIQASDPRIAPKKRDGNGGTCEGGKREVIYELNLLERTRGESRNCIPSHTHAQHTPTYTLTEHTATNAHMHTRLCCAHRKWSLLKKSLRPSLMNLVFSTVTL